VECVMTTSKTDPKELLLNALRAGMRSVHVLHKYRLVHQRLAVADVRCGTDLTINLKLMTTN
jgi:hypothetical protein